MEIKRHSILFAKELRKGDVFRIANSLNSSVYMKVQLVEDKYCPYTIDAVDLYSGDLIEIKKNTEIEHY